MKKAFHVITKILGIFILTLLFLSFLVFAVPRFFGITPDIVLSGSIFKCKFRGFQEAVEEEILKRIPGANVIAAEYEPVVGAVLMGLKRTNKIMTGKIYRNIEEGAGRFPVRRLENI